jgi:O-antigen biosynthesis protein
LYMIDIHAINSPQNVRNKRLFDMIAALLLLVFSPLICWIEKNPLGFFANIFWVLIGEKSYVGYAPVSENQKSTHLLPAIKKGVITPLDVLPSKTDTVTINDANSIYARDYKVGTDIRMIWKGFRSLGRK